MTFFIRYKNKHSIKNIDKLYNIKIDIKVITLYIIFILIACMKDSAYSKKETKVDVNIESVQIDLEKKENPELSLSINIKNYGERINTWKLGFYMSASSFYKGRNTQEKYNPNLVMRICNKSHTCTPLMYTKAKNIKDQDLSHGSTTILSPIGTYPLEKGEKYTLECSHNNQWGHGNISFYPQNFFLILPEANEENRKIEQTYYLPTTKDTYKVSSYNAKTVNANIEGHINKNWSESLPLDQRQMLMVIPTPVHIIFKNGEAHKINKKISIINHMNNSEQITSMMSKALMQDLNVTTSNDLNSPSKILIKPLSKPYLIQNNPEGYILFIDKEEILIEAKNNTGLYYAFQTLRQLWNNDKIEHGAVLPNIQVIDYPRFKYRGLLLDTARHFFTVNEIKLLIDMMGTHKLNVLHLHLSDDEAFRLQLKSYPTLASIGGTRGLGQTIGPSLFIQGNLYKSYSKDTFPHANTVYSGTYSSSDIKNIIHYANTHQITIIPEIDLPAHSRALIKALPRAFIDPNDHSNYVSAQGYTDNVIPVCTYNSTISVGPGFTRTINTIINDIAQLFSGQKTLYAIDSEISVGGDEVSSSAWTNDKSCKAEWVPLSALEKSHKFFKMLSISNPNIFFSGWQQFVQTENEKLGNEVVPTERTAHVWVWSPSNEGVHHAAALANSGYKVVLAFADKTYFDLSYTPHLYETGLNWANHYSDTCSSLTSALSATRTLANIKPFAQNNIVGIEGTLWSELLASYQAMTYMALPKMAGLSEASWSPSEITNKYSKVNWQSLATRLGCGKNGFLKYLSTIYGVRYRGFPNGIWLEVPKKIYYKNK